MPFFVVASLVAALSLTASAQKTFDRYSAVVYNSQNDSATVGVDFRHHGHYTQGRAGVIFNTTGYGNVLKSYPLFNTTFSVPSSWMSSGCTFNTGQLELFDLSDNGWLRNAESKDIPGGKQYSATLRGNALIPEITSPGWELITNPNISIHTDFHGMPYAMNVTTEFGSLLRELRLKQFSEHVSRMFPDDSSWAPPPDRCIVPQHQCNGSINVQTMDLYRSHDNSSYRHVIENSNTADPAGEVYFLCHLSGGPYVTHFQVDMSTRYNLYTECNGGFCSFHEYGISPAPGSSYGDSLGVGREESLGNNMGDGHGQCDPPGTNPVGFWYSMNLPGMCNSGQQVGYDNCTWSADYTVVKTVERSCLNITCGPSSWSAAAQAFVKSFAACPDVNALLPLSTRQHLFDSRAANYQQQYQKLQKSKTAGSENMLQSFISNYLDQNE